MSLLKTILDVLRPIKPLPIEPVELSSLFSRRPPCTDALVPELWARESLVILEENMVVANIIHREMGW